MHRFVTRRLLALGVIVGVGRSVVAQGTPDFERAPVRYSATAPEDAVTRLQRAVAAGSTTLSGLDQEYLRAVLRELHVPVESQMVVFSKTSLQRGLIRPRQPRALYFSDSIYVGWVPGGLMEVIAVDPQLGPVFYAVDPRARPGARREFTRDEDCLRCHGGAFVRDIPGVFARSLSTSESGEPLLRHGSELVDDETPFERRWGGWYVTGYKGPLNHRGNVFGEEQGEQLVLTPSSARPDALSEFFDTARYLAPTSDVVALLVFEHQMAVQNALTHAGQSCRRMLEYQRSLQQTLGDPPTDEPSYDSVKSVFASAVEQVVDHLLFRGAAPLPEGVIGAESFRSRFLQGAPRSKGGHALKDLQLGRRLFANRCSYLIYSESFAALPGQLKARIFDQLRGALRDDNPRGRYAYLEADEKRRIEEILLETLPEARERWESKRPPATRPGGEY